MVELVFEREVRMPPLAPPELSLKVVAAAVQLSDRALRGDGGLPSLLRATRTCAALLKEWVGAIAAARASSAPDGLSANTGQVSGAASSAGNIIGSDGIARQLLLGLVEHRHAAPRASIDNLVCRSLDGWSFTERRVN